MKACQVGTRNYVDANNLHAQCYRTIGKLLADADRQRQHIAPNGSTVNTQELAMSYSITTQAALRAAFWAAHPQFQRRGNQRLCRFGVQQIRTGFRQQQ